MAVARDKFWLFGVRPHQDDTWFRRGVIHPENPWSRITPAEGAYILNVPNVAMIICDGEPAPFSKDSLGYAESFKRLSKVLWGCAGSDGFRTGNEEKFVLSLAEKYPNICGAYLDDFVGDLPDETVLAELKKIRETLDRAPHRMEMAATWYFHKKTPLEALDYLDTVAMWTWHQEDLVNLPTRFAELESKCTKQKKFIGIYLFDFTSGLPVTEENMELQCNFALDMLKQGRADGIMFEANSVMGVGFPSEQWAIDWIEKVKDTPVPD